MADSDYRSALTIGQLIQKLSTIDPDKRIYYDFTNCIPTKIGSWRGVYAEPALGWSPSGYTKQVDQYPTVGNLLKELRDAISGRVYTGWKGGEYCYSEDSPLHVANDGDYDCNGTVIVDVDDSRYSTILVTLSDGNGF